MNKFEVTMQHNPYENERISAESLAKQIDFVWDDFTIGNYNFLVLAYVNEAAYMQMTLDEDAYFVVEVLHDKELYQIKVDERSTVKAMFKGYLSGFDIDFTPFTNITKRIH